MRKWWSDRPFAAVVTVVLAALLIGAAVLAVGITQFGPDEKDANGAADGNDEFVAESLLSDASPTNAVTRESLSARRVCDEDFPTDSEESQQSGGVTVGPSDDAPAVASANPAGTTFLFEAGTHELARAIEAETGDRFIGESGAILDGGLSGDFGAIKGNAEGVEVANLTIANFGSADGRGSINSAAVNRSVADGWNVHGNRFVNNDGAALFLGSESSTERNCFENNGQYGLSLPSRQSDGEEISIRDASVIGNHFVGNNRNDLESAGGCSGCVGAMKFWAPERLVVSGNLVEANNGVGIWVDHNGVDVTIESNVVVDNDKAGIVIETSYNSRIWSNYVANNSVAAGSLRPVSDPFPDAGIFISNSGGIEHAGELEPVIDIGGNRIENNWNGITIFEDQNRFCASESNESVGRCTRTGGTVDSCFDAAVASDSALLEQDCRWRSRHIAVHHNSFATQEPALNSAVVNEQEATARVVSSVGTQGEASIEPRDRSLWDLTSPSVNRFFDNTYEGQWSFGGPKMSARMSFEDWQKLGQDQS